MSENKAYWERHGTKNKSQSRMQEAYSPRPKESVVDVSKTPETIVPVIDGNGALYERLEQMDRELVAIRTYLLESKSDQNRIEEIGTEQSKILSVTVPGGEDEKVSEGEEEEEEEDVPHKLTTLQSVYVFIMYLRSVTLEEIVLAGYETVRSHLSPDLLLRTLMELQPPTASNISDCFHNMKIFAVNATDSFRYLMGIDGKTEEVALADDIKEVGIDHGCNSRSEEKTEIGKGNQIPQSLAALPIANESPPSSSSDEVDLPNSELKDPTSTKHSKRWWIQLW